MNDWPHITGETVPDAPRPSETLLRLLPHGWGLRIASLGFRGGRPYFVLEAEGPDGESDLGLVRESGSTLEDAAFNLGLRLAQAAAMVRLRRLGWEIYFLREGLPEDDHTLAHPPGDDEVLVLFVFAFDSMSEEVAVFGAGLEYPGRRVRLAHVLPEHLVSAESFEGFLGSVASSEARALPDSYQDIADQQAEAEAEARAEQVADLMASHKVSAARATQLLDQPWLLDPVYRRAVDIHGMPPEMLGDEALWHERPERAARMLGERLATHLSGWPDPDDWEAVRTTREDELR